jgi:hypothetical protein
MIKEFLNTVGKCYIVIPEMIKEELKLLIEKEKLEQYVFSADDNRIKKDVVIDSILNDYVLQN